MNHLLRIAAVAGLLALVAPAAAQPKPAPQTAPQQDSAQPQAAEPSEAQREEARAAYARGQALFAESKYEQALAAFEQAYAAVPNPVVLLGIAECLLQLGRLDEAVDAFKRYLAARSDAPERAAVEQKIADLEALPATLALSTDPPGAAVTLDGQPTGKVTPVELEVERGPREVQLSLEGHKDFSETVTAKLGARHELHVELLVQQPAEPAPPPPPTPAPEPADVPPAAGPPTTALWVTGIVGAAGLVSGTVLGFMALAERSDFDANPTAESADRGERLALFADVSFGIGAMALITGAVLYLTADDAAAPAATPETAHNAVRLAPLVAHDAAGLQASGSF